MILTKIVLFNKTFLTTLLALGLTFSLSACSNNNNKKPEKKYKTLRTLNQQQTLETGTVLATKTIQIEPERVNSYGNIGVAVGSGGFRGIHGSIDLATIGRILKTPAEPKMGQEIIVKKQSGQIVAITQSSNESFNKGDTVKILVRNGKALVIH